MSGKETGALQMPIIEAEMTSFLRHLFPDYEQQCVGATTEQIERLEQIAGRPLPAFYHWFLRTMGRSVGPFEKARQDLSIDSILAAYDEGLVEPDPRLLLIAGDKNEEDPILGFYDLDEPARDDALVLTAQGYDGHLTRMYESLREMFAHDNIVAFKIRSSPCYCLGRFTDPGHDVSSKLDHIMDKLGFASAVPTGPYCKVLERTDAMMAGWASPSEDRRHLMFFHFGGPDEQIIRRLLGEISDVADLEIKVDEWGSPAA
jgi:hypothetical protein